ncbi:MAG: MarC family protein [Salibacteraceae bacterium]|jgi:multiple antibiotic resistance protein|nr:MarC family protein [Salibacteraceae bacterium]MDP4685490.1 MarC family protein [Salibacteraceae bacterium]MDP4762755.1 MarC family protein [Salibacteraceae bacterium]MDP4843916.1 MarC family protein [Salibacteraceae bacterium]MDP4933411.1 MarC family protein [Salibacteraceae bacterium]
MFDIKEISTASMILFAVIDIIGSIPIIIQLRQKSGHIQSEKASIVSLLIMIMFLYLGEEILSLIGIDINSFAIAGSFILFFLSLELILGINLYKEDPTQSSSSSIVPLAFPLIAGAGTMTSLVSLRAEYEIQNIIIAIILNIGLVYIVLKNTIRIEHLLGSIGIAILRKVFGIILLAIAVKLFRTNLGLM